MSGGWSGVDLRRELLLREDEEFRLAVAGLLGLEGVLGELRRLREDFNALVGERARRWEEADRKFRWIMGALAEIRGSLGGAFEYYAANVVRALLAERGFSCDVRVDVTLPVDGFREVDVLCLDPLMVGGVSLRSIEEAERGIEKLLADAEAAERFTGMSRGVGRGKCRGVVEYLRRRAEELGIFLITTTNPNYILPIKSTRASRGSTRDFKSVEEGGRRFQEGG